MKKSYQNSPVYWIAAVLLWCLLLISFWFHGLREYTVCYLYALLCMLCVRFLLPPQQGRRPVLTWWIWVMAAAGVAVAIWCCCFAPSAPPESVYRQSRLLELFCIGVGECLLFVQPVYK